MEYTRIVKKLCEEHGCPEQIFVSAKVRDGFIWECQKLSRHVYDDLPKKLIAVSFLNTRVLPWPEGDLCGC